MQALEPAPPLPPPLSSSSEEEVVEEEQEPIQTEEVVEELVDQVDTTAIINAPPNWSWQAWQRTDTRPTLCAGGRCGCGAPPHLDRGRRAG